MIRILLTINDKLEEVLCALLLSGIVALMGTQVVGRYVLGFVSPVFEEVSRWFFVWFIYLGAALGAKRGGHFRVVVYKLIFKGKADAAVTILGDLIWLGFNIIMIIAGTQFVISTIKQQYLSPALMFPMKYIYLIIPLGYSLIAIRMITFSIKNILPNERKKGHVSR